MEAAIRPGPAMFPFFMPQYNPHAAMTGINPQRFRLPMQQPPFHFNPTASLFPALHVNPSIMPHQPLPPHPQQAPPPRALQQRMPSTTPQPPPRPPTQPTPTTLTSSVSPVSNLTLTFTQEEVDSVLYGYTKGRTSDRYHGHALSGLKFGDLSHGIDRILSDHNSPTGSASDGTGSTCSGRDSVSGGSSSVKHSPNSNISNNTSRHVISPAFSPHQQQQQQHHQHLHAHHHQQQQQQQQQNTHQDNSSTPNIKGPTTPLSDNKWNLNTSLNNKANAADMIHNNNNNKHTPSHGGSGHVINKLHLDPAALGLQDGLAIFQTHFAGTIHTGVFCIKTVISRGTRYGPFKGRVINTSEVKTLDDNSVMWEIFQEGKLSHFIDGQSGTGNWMSFINCARYAQEQNLIAIQVEGEIWYETCKDIPQGTELLVWYGDCYLQFMGVPVALKEMADGGAQDEADSSEGFQCDRCGKVFAYKYYRDKHLKYTRCVDQGDRKYPCHLCSRSFEKRDRLRIHILHVHEKHRPHKCLVCGKSFSQSSSLNKHMRVHSGERPYKCVYCNKAFTASSILRTHIRQHSGEKPFKCKHCGKAFASHAAHDSHVRRTHAKEQPCKCTVCGKSFQQAYQLKFHMGSHMGQ